MRSAARLAPLCLFISFTWAQQQLDEGYTAKIKEYTTDPVFLTELVDHLPASDKVPTPEKFFGYVAAAPNKLTYAKDIYRYMRAVAAASPRIRVLTMGSTEEGREMVLVLASDEANLARLDHFREITNKLADPRKLIDAEAEKLADEGLPFYWATGSIHSPETGSPEMLMELVYRFAVEETSFIQNIRKNMIVMITPVIEVDGREKQVDLYNWRKANPNRPAPNLVYWGRYVQHDNNRDGIGLSLALSRNVTSTFLEYKPQILHDLHESVPFLYTSTGMGPYNAWLDPIVINEWQKLAYVEIEEMTKRGVPGVWTHGFYDGWAANYMMEAAHGHNSIGRFYETFGNGGADTRERTVPAASTSRTWFRQNPPYARVNWSQRNNCNMQQSALLIAMNYTATNRQTFLRNFYLKSKRSVAKATAEGPAAYVISTTERPHEAANLVALLRRHGVEVQRLSAETEIAGAKHAKGAFVVRMDQPYSRLADMLLDKQYYNVNDPPPYDDTGWTLGPLMNLKTARVTEAAILKASMVPTTDDTLLPEGRIEGAGAAAYLLNNNADRILATARFRLKDVKILAAEESFEANGRKYTAGTWIIKSEGNPGDLRTKVQALAADLALTFQAVAEAPKVAAHELAAPRIALVHTWTSTQNEGWFRLAFDSAKVPYTYISDQMVRQTPNLRERFDVIVLGPASGGAQRVVNGIPSGGQPIPWKASELTPNFATSPDQTDNMRGGMELEGLLNVKKFVEEGGLFVTIAGNSEIPINYGLIDGITVVPSQQLRVRGSVVQAEVADAKSPIVYGYDSKVGVYFNQAPIFNVSLTGGMGFGGGGGAGQGGPQGRPSGRGGTSDPDIPQGRPFRANAPTPPPDPNAPSAEMMEQLRAFLPPPEERPRIVLRFGSESDLLISGMLAGGRELAGKPAIVDVPKGKGHYLLFATNPMWRHETQGSWSFLFNAALNFDNLNVGRRTAPPRASEPTTIFDDDDDQQ